MLNDRSDLKQVARLLRQEMIDNEQARCSAEVLRHTDAVTEAIRQAVVDRRREIPPPPPFPKGGTTDSQ